MLPWTTTLIRPSSQRVFSGTTTGATWYYRAGVPVEIWHHRETYGTGIYRVFIAGRFTGGWGTQDQATTYATRF